nr:disease resistance protein TAO1-like [Ipomoea batatas]
MLLQGTREVEGIILDLEKKKKISKIISAKRIASTQLQTTPNFTSALTYLREVFKQHGFLRNDSNNVIVRSESFDPMVNLRLLQFSNVKVEGNVGKLPNSLRWLQWRNCPLKTFPSNFYPRELAVLDFSESPIRSVGNWKWSWNSKKVTNRLKVMNLRGCYNITALPDLSAHKALEKLTLELCTSLKSIHKSIGDLKALRHLNLERCSELIEFPSDVSGLKNLEILILSRCSRLKHLPENIGWMNALRELMVDGTAVEELPESIFRLTKLERLSLANCHSLKMLPRCIGNLCSLEDLSLYGSGVELIPDSIGSLGNLETLNLQWCRSMAVIPSSVGNLKSLANLYLNGSAIQILPESIGSLYYLRALKVGSCKDQTTLPDSIKGLSSLVDLELDSTEITGLPSEIGALKSLEKLEIRNCKNLGLIPNSIGNLLALKTLIITSSAIKELPESLGMLENLVMMRLNQCTKLSSLPSSIGHLKNLRHLIMDHTSVSALPETFGMLSNLMVLRMGKKPSEPISHTTNTTTLPFSFSNLSVLEEFDARGWRISGNIPDDFGQLSSLETLNLSYNQISGLPSSMRGLCVLKMLVISHCKLLIALPSLPSSLVKLNAANCIALETIFDLSNLQNLQELNLTNCERLVDVPGIENMNSLRMLHMSGCTSCAFVIATKLHKDAVKKLYSFSIPGSEIPNWFTQGEVCFSSRRNIGIKGVIVSIIVSVNHQIPADLRDELPVIPNIHAKILRVNEPIYTTAMHLVGVPRKPEDNLYLCKFPDCHPLVSVLEDGDIIQVGISSGLPIQGIELKKCGIHLVFENDDDYGGTEESLEENQQSVSEKLTRFIGSSSSSSVVNGNHTSSSTVGGWTLLGFLQDMLCFFKKLWD